jgi:hypothetical protein
MCINFGYPFTELLLNSLVRKIQSDGTAVTAVGFVALQADGS